MVHRNVESRDLVLRPLPDSLGVSCVHTQTHTFRDGFVGWFGIESGMRAAAGGDV